jgi:type VI secretion system secreted protein VgrG
VRIQFAWQRGGRPNPGGLAHDTDDKGCAPGDERSGTWVRVAEALAGPNWGTLFTPRVGTEVLVDFIEGDIDRPVVVAQLFTGPDLPPFAAGVDSGVEHAGTLSGIHSHNFDGGGFNQWQIDDTAGQVRTRLATSTAATQLNLGYLIQQSPGSAQRGAWRGTGFELRTDAWGAVRGGEGVLLSTSERSQQGCGVTSTQMDAHEAVSLLKGAQGLGKTLGDAAAQQQALFSKDAAAAQSDFIEQVDPKEKGKYAGAVNGQTALKAKSGSREPDGSQPVEKFGTAIVLMDSAASINWATPASTVIYAGKQLQWTAQSDLHLTAAHTVASVAANAASLFTHSGGIQAIAGNGPLSLQAHTDGLEIVADKEITVISVNDCIEIKAKQKIVLQAGQAAVTLEGGDITFACPGKFSVKGGKHFFDKGSKRSSATTPLPDTRVKLFAQQIRAVNEATGEPIAQLSYKMETGDGDVFYGDTDDDGNTIQTRTVSQQAVKVWWGVLPPGQDGDA